MLTIVLGLGLMFGALLLLVKKAEGGVSGSPTLTPIPTPAPSTDTIGNMISYSAAKYGVSSNLVRAVAMTESSLNPNATNPNDPSYGLMGIMPILAEDFGIVKDWHNPTAAEIAMIRDPQTNLNIGAWHLARLLKQYSFDVAIQMYNVGVTGYNEGARAESYLKKVKGYLNG